MTDLQKVDVRHPAFGEPPEAVERTFSALEGKLDEVATARGELALTVPIACVEARKPGAT